MDDITKITNHHTYSSSDFQSFCMHLWQHETRNRVSSTFFYKLFYHPKHI